MTKEELLNAIVVTDGVASIDDAKFDGLFSGYVSSKEVALIKAQHTAELRGVQHSGMLDLALSSVNTHDTKLLKSLLDVKKLKFGETVEGLDEQITSLKESKPYLFKNEDVPSFTGATPTTVVGVDNEEDIYLKQLLGGI